MIRRGPNASTRRRRKLCPTVPPAADQFLLASMISTFGQVASPQISSTSGEAASVPSAGSPAECTTTGTPGNRLTIVRNGSRAVARVRCALTTRPSLEATAHASAARSSPSQLAASAAAPP